MNITKYYKGKFYLKLSTDLTEQGFLLTYVWLDTEMCRATDVVILLSIM